LRCKERRQRSKGKSFVLIPIFPVKMAWPDRFPAVGLATNILPKGSRVFRVHNFFPFCASARVFIRRFHVCFARILLKKSALAAVDLR
jgi:hypothetical protein